MLLLLQLFFHMGLKGFKGDFSDYDPQEPSTPCYDTGSLASLAALPAGASAAAVSSSSGAPASPAPAAPSSDLQCFAALLANMPTEKRPQQHPSSPVLQRAAAEDLLGVEVFVQVWPHHHPPA